MKKRIDIEALLRWVYVEEMPKQGVSVASNLSRMLEYGMAIDESHFGGAMPIALGEPHPDALKLDYAVRSLPPVRLALPMARHLLGELALYLTREVVRAVEVGIVKRGRREIAGVVTREKVETVTRVEPRLVEPSVLVPLHARLGNRPHWDFGPPSVVRVLGKNNKPIVNGITKGGRYADGAHCPVTLDPSAEHIVRARFDYISWWMALVELAESCQLTEHEALPPRAAAEPWLTGPETKGKIYRNTEMQIPERSQRSRVELPPLKSSHGKGRHVPVTTLDDTTC